MAPSELYRRQVALLVNVLPFVAKEEIFALKGGTAINLFIRNLPRLSVDIDLTYLPISEREKSLKDIHKALQRIASSISAAFPKMRVTTVAGTSENLITKLIVRQDNTQIKIEVTPVLRGCVFAPETRSVSPVVEEEFGFVEMQIVSFADLYAGKIMAALDRQHPRDLFDVKDLLANEGINDELRAAFLIYLISHDRPISEVLSPKWKDISHEFIHGFEGMTTVPVKLEELLETRERLIDEIVNKMPQPHRKFLLGFKQGNPDWNLIGLPEVAVLPAVKWKQINLERMAADAKAQAILNLKKVLGL